jgi:putative pyrroloquinoline-quinone binding quinoprotein
MRAPSFLRSNHRVLALLLAVSVVVVALPSGRASAAIAPGTLLWKRIFGATTYGGVVALTVSPDGSKVLVAGGANGAVVTAAYTAAGTKLWLKSYTLPGYQVGTYGIAVAPDGQTVVVTGNAYDENTLGDFLTVAYDAGTGEQLWDERYDRGSMDADENTTSQSDTALGVAVSADSGTIFVTGDSEIVLGDMGYFDSLTVAYDAATGDVDWTHVYDGGYGGEGTRSIGAASDGSAVFITGFSASATYSAAFTSALDPATGDELWVERFEGPAGLNDSALSLAVSPDGSRVYITGATGGTVSGGADWDMVTVAYNATNGDKVWTRFFAGNADGYDFGRSVTVSDDGTRVYVVGHSLGDAATYDVTTIAYNATTGKRAWVQRAPGVAVNSGLTADIAASPDGTKIVVVAYRDRFLQQDASVTTYSKAGVLLWKKLYDGSDSDRFRSVAIAPSGAKAYVGGAAGGGITIAYKL